MRTTLAQMAAIAGHDTRARLPELRGLPVTVLHGDEDVLVPVDRGHELAERIPGARMAVVPGAGHVLTTDREHETAEAVLRHLEERPDQLRKPSRLKAINRPREADFFAPRGRIWV